MTQQTSFPRSRPRATGLVFGLAGLAFSPLVVVGLVLSAVGLSRASKGIATNKGLSIAGAMVSLAGLAVCTAWAVGFGKAVEEPERVSRSSYEMTVDSTYGADAVETGIGG
ncbi:hypothetical protein [Amycolatopsis sp. NPDC059657]|uniref:hypothetical protein n=1 Tax=Amycolatopsis sp. NPDC059657 TaxID=3346899 RepID=UPI00366CC889